MIFVIVFITVIIGGFIWWYIESSQTTPVNIKPKRKHINSFNEQLRENIANDVTTVLFKDDTFTKDQW